MKAGGRDPSAQRTPRRVPRPARYLGGERLRGHSTISRYYLRRNGTGDSQVLPPTFPYEEQRARFLSRSMMKIRILLEASESGIESRFELGLLSEGL